MRKNFSVVLIVFILVICNFSVVLPCSGASQPSSETAGDVNLDGKILTSDYYIVKFCAAGRNVISQEKNEKNADVDGNGKIDDTDCMLIRMYMAGVIKSFDEDIDLIMSDPDATATIYQMSTADDALMMSYLIVTGNGNLIMIDGGMTGSSNYNSVYTQIKKYGQLKKRDNVIDAWIFTHPHNDHVKTFCQILKTHPEISINNFYFNFPTEEEILAMPEAEHTYTEDLKSFIDSFNTSMGSDTAYDEYPRTEAGDSFVIDGVKFDILQTYKSAGNAYGSVDDCSMVIRMTVASQTVLFLGDLREESGRDLLDKYGDKLKSDIVQMSRHGQNGVEKAVYEAVQPQVCLWPTPMWVWNTNESNHEIRGWMQELGVKYHNLAREGWMDEKYKSLNLSDNSIAIPSEYVIK